MWNPQRIYADYLLRQPTIFLGKDSINGLAGIPCSKISVIHGSSIDKSIISSLERIFKKKSIYFNKRSWNGEPSLNFLAGTIKELEKQIPDVIIAIGGGSVIDGAKMCRLYYEYPAFEVGKTRLNQLEFSTRFIAIPTTIGSGAEASSAAVYINEDEHKKEMIVFHALQPEAIVLDPAYVSNASYRLIASSGIDAMAHILEGYVSNVNNGICDILAETGFRILVKEFNKTGDMDFEHLQYAGYLGGIVQNHCIVGAAHGIAHQLSADGYSHGEAVSLVLNAVIKANAKDENICRKYNQLLECAGMGSIDEFSKFLDNILEKSGIGTRKSEFKSLIQCRIKDDSFVQNIANDQGAKGNPVEINKEYLEILLGEM